MPTKHPVMKCPCDDVGAMIVTIGEMDGMRMCADVKVTIANVEL